MEPLTIEQAAASLQKHLDGPNGEDVGVFCVFPNQGGGLSVNVNFIYRVNEVEAIKDWEGFSVCVARRSCW